MIADYDGSPVTAEAFTALFKEVSVILDDPKRLTTKPGASENAFTGTITCAECGSGLRVSKRGKAPAYVCRDKGCTKIDKATTDRIITAEIIVFLARPEVYAAVLPEDGGAELDSVRAQLVGKRAELSELKAAPRPSGARAKIALLAMIEELEDEITALEARETELTPRPSAVAKLFDYGPDVERRWKATPVAVQRQLAALLLVPGVLGEVRVTRAAGAETVADRIKWATIA